MAVQVPLTLDGLVSMLLHHTSTNCFWHFKTMMMSRALRKPSLLVKGSLGLDPMMLSWHCTCEDLIGRMAAP